MQFRREEAFAGHGADHLQAVDDGQVESDERNGQAEHSIQDHNCVVGNQTHRAFCFNQWSKGRWQSCGAAGDGHVRQYAQSAAQDDGQGQGLPDSPGRSSYFVPNIDDEV